MKRPEVWLGDLLRVFAELRPDAQEAAAVAKMLRLERTSTVPEALRLRGAWSPAASPQHAAPVSPKVQVSPERPPAERPPAERPSGETSAAPGAHSDVRLTHFPAEHSGPNAPHWVPFTTTMSGPVKKPPAPAPPPPLIERRVQRAILSAAVATSTADGPPDVTRILEAFTQRRPLPHLPRLMEKTLRHGVQMLVDCGAGMSPFSSDQQSVIKAIRGIIAPDRFAHLRFAGCPTRGAGTGPRQRWLPWIAPPRRAVILLLSDLGIGGPLLDPDRAGLSEWLGFARAARSAGCPLVAFVPYEPARWPAELAQAMTFIHWSERLTAGAIRRAIGRPRTRPS